MKHIGDFVHHLFVPKESNNYRAKALHVDAMLVYLVLALCVSLIYQYFESHANTQNVLGYATDITKEKLFELTNQEREKQGLQPLVYNEKLAQAAEQKAMDMFARDYWAHYGPDGSTPWEFILGAGYEYEYAGENLAKNFMFSDGVVKAWMNSPTHRENILRSEYTEIGFAHRNGLLNGEETTLVVQMFGAPMEGTAVLAEDTGGEIEQAQQLAFQEGQNRALAQEDGRTLASYPVINENTVTATTPFRIMFNIKFVFLLFLFGVLALDLYVGTKMHLFRMNGKNLVHMLFIGFVLVGIYFLTKGAII